MQQATVQFEYLDCVFVGHEIQQYGLGTGYQNCHPVFGLQQSRKLISPSMETASMFTYIAARIGRCAKQSAGMI